MSDTDKQPKSFAQQMAEGGYLADNKKLQNARHRTEPDNTALEWWNRPLERILFGIFCLLLILVAVVVL